MLHSLAKLFRTPACRLLPILWLCSPILHAASSWPQFRGPGGSGIGQGTGYPSVFSEKTNLLWKIETANGNSSPVIWDNRLFLTSFENEKLIVSAYDLKSGGRQWQNQIQPIKIERGHQNGSPATSTPAVDRELLIAYFGSFGLVAYTHDGKELWRRELPVPVTQHGAGSSPVLYSHRIYLVCDEDVASSMLCLDATNGKVIWKNERPTMRRGFSTPLIWPQNNPHTLIVAGTLQLKGYDLVSGKEKWSVSGLPNEMVSSPIGDQEKIYVAGWTLGSGFPTMPHFDEVLQQLDTNKDGMISQKEAISGPTRNNFGYIDADKDDQITRAEYDAITKIFAASKNAIMAVTPGGNDHATPGAVWTQTKGLPYAPSPLLYSNCVYTIKNGGMASCFDATTGHPYYLEERVGIVGDYYASPVVADGNIYLCSQQGSVVVLEAGKEFKVVAVNPLPDRIMSTPALVGGKIYLRTLSNLYCFGK